ncbi:MAG: recombinase [Crocinitomicaceae bacterium]|nr:recombinase [Crocinitomicaceae bacterium]
MKLRHRTIFKKPLSTIFDSLELGKTEEARENQLRTFADLVNIVRPKYPKEIDFVSIEPILEFLRENEDRRLKLAELFNNLVDFKTFKNILTDAGILQDSSFKEEIKRRIISKVIPFQPKKETLEYILTQVFYLQKDIIWIEKIPLAELIQLYDLLEVKSIYFSVENKSSMDEILNAMRLITQRMSGRALEAEVMKMIPEYDNLESPFEALEKAFDDVENKVRDSYPHRILSDDIDFRHLQIVHLQCVQFVEKAYKNSSKFGISLQVNQSLLRIKQQLSRLETLWLFLVAENEEAEKFNSIQLILRLIQYNCIKNNVSKLFNESTQLIAYEITQHTAKTGEHYITSSTKEYFSMFKSAMLGGVIVGVLCVIKLLLGKIPASDLGHALIYSANYAIGFTTIYLIGATLATKQPAMTAAALIQSIEKGKGEKKDIKYRSFAELFARLFRSQFIAFVGNVLLAFPVSLIGIWLLDFIFNINFAESKWPKLLTDNSPIHSPAIFHAAIAGVFLFLAGIISGSISNSNKHNQLYYRIQEHPILKMSLGKARTMRIANWFEKKWAGVASNIWFGIFMGSTASVGAFIGLDLDIRHITFVSGNLALGLFGANFHISSSMLFWATFGIAVIGFMNFIVSFLLSLTLAFRSRSIPLSELKFLFRAVWKYFKKNPFLFFIPVKPKDIKKFKI